MSLDGPQSQLEHCGKKKTLAVSGILTLAHPACSIIIVLAVLFLAHKIIVYAHK
jgi:hypothetical protein